MQPSPLPEAFVRALAEQYRIERELGHGGMARVLLAHDVRHGRSVAIKVLRADLAALIGADRFLAEIQLTARLQHPHILPLYDSGVAGELLYYVMPVLGGGSLQEYLDAHGAIPLVEAVRVIAEVGAALDYAHRQGVIHRDIKPANILLHDGSALLADFGIARAASASDDARLTETGLSIGTPQYMSPEQASGERDLTPASDIYSLGVVAYELIAGSVPFEAASLQALLVKLLTADPPPLERRVDGVPPQVDEAVRKALSKDATARFATVGDFVAALRAGLEQPTLRLPARARRPPRRWPWAAVGTILLATVVWGWSRLGAVGDRRPALPRLLAVLPFANGTRDTSKAILGHGFAVEITDELHRLGVGVVGSSAATLAAHRFASSEGIDIQAVGRSLGASAVLDGTLLDDSAGVRLALQLTDVRDQQVLWSETYTLGDGLFSVQDAVAHEVAVALRLSLSQSQLAELRRGRSVDPLAHELVVRAKGNTIQRRPTTLSQAVALFTAALARDSTYAEAWAGLAEVYNLQAVSARHPRDLFVLATVAADRALALDSTSAAAHRARAFLQEFYTHDWTAAGREFSRALAIDSLDPETWLFRTWYFMALREPDSMMASIRRARALDSLTPIYPVRLADIEYLAGADTAAERELRAILARDPTDALVLGSLAPVLARLDRCPEALRALGAIPETRWGQVGNVAMTIRTLAHCGQLDSLRTLLRSGEARVAADSAVGGVNLALGATYLGNEAAVYRWLQYAVDTDDWMLFFVNGDPEFDPYRKDPRFRAILQRLGMPVG